MTIEELGFMVLEAVRSNQIADDEDIDIRLVYDWIDLKRSQFIKNSRSQNPNNRLNLNLYQTEPISLTVTTLTDVGNYPYSSAVEDTKIVESSDTIPTIIEDKSGPIVLSLESQDLIKPPFSIVSFDQLRWSGNGRFNSGIIYGAIRDNKVYFKYNEFFDTYTDVNLLAVFEDPREVTGFDEETDRYPVDLTTAEYIKNAIFDKDIRMIFNSVSDEVNNAESDV